MIIAECCGNHGGDMAVAKEMIRVSKECGAGLTKFQLYDAETDRDKSYYDAVKKAELNLKSAEMLFNYGAKIGQEVFFSVFAPKYVDWCEAIGVKRYKIAAGGWIGKKQIIDAVVSTHKPVIISTRKSLDISNTAHKTLYCPDGYPQIDFKMPYFQGGGFSDHTVGIDAAKIALARGAKIVEKHFCLDHNPDFPDDKWSMDVNGLRELVRFEKVCQEVL